MECWFFSFYKTICLQITTYKSKYMKTKENLNRHPCEWRIHLNSSLNHTGFKQKALAVSLKFEPNKNLKCSMYIMCGLCCKLNQMKYEIFDFKGENLKLRGEKTSYSCNSYINKIQFKNQINLKVRIYITISTFTSVCPCGIRKYVIRSLLQLGCAGKARIPRLSYDEIHR